MTARHFLPLSRSDISAAIDSTIGQQLDDILIKDSVSSTNDELWQRFRQGKDTPAVCLAESQTSGRGRRDNHWHSPLVGNLYLSMFWPFPAPTSQNGLSLAIGISLIKVLNSVGINDLQLKWPNDILYKRQKLAGILVESRCGNQQNTVVGMGINFKLPATSKNKINQATTSLQQICNKLPCRNKLAAKIIQTMITTLQRFQHRGFSDFIPQWHQYDALANQTITLIDGEVRIQAIALGINDQGELQYILDNKLHTLSNSHVSIKFGS